MCGIIIAGFPGTGRTYVTENLQSDLGITCCDLNSATFKWLKPGLRNPEFPNNYITRIKESMNEYDVVFINTTREVRDKLYKNDLKAYIVFPFKSSKDEYMQRYINRGDENIPGYIELMDSKFNGAIEELTEDKRFDHIRFINSCDTMVDAIESLKCKGKI